MRLAIFVFSAFLVAILCISLVSVCVQQKETTLPGKYHGALPCDGCDGIDTVLLIKSDGMYQMAQKRRDVGETVHRSGNWYASEDGMVLALLGFENQFLVISSDVLELLDKNMEPMRGVQLTRTSDYRP